MEPKKVDWMRPKIRYHFGLRAPNGGELIMSLPSAIYYAWVDILNLPIKVRASVRKTPFTAFIYTLTPSLRPLTLLTSYKVGIAYC